MKLDVESYLEYPEYKGGNDYHATSFDKNYFTQGVNDCLSCVNDSMSDLDKIIAVHEWICLNAEYDMGSLELYEKGALRDYSCFSAYGIFGKGTAVCQGYAMAYKLIMDYLGIECYMVTNYNHAWNLVKLDGSYYYLDTTWDDPTGTEVGYVRHINMLRSDDGITETGHTGYSVSGMRSNPTTSTKYDSAFWQSSKSQIILDNGAYIYGDNANFAIYRKSSYSASPTKLVTLSYWRIPNTNSYYPSTSFCNLAEMNGRILYNTSKNVISMNKSGGDSKTLYTCGNDVNIYYFGVQNGVPMGYLGSDYNNGGTYELGFSASDMIMPPTSIKPDVTELTMAEGDTYSIYTSYYPSYSTVPTIMYSSANKAIASVDSDGLITAVGEGDTTITVYCKDNSSVQAKIVVHVVSITQMPTVSITYDETSHILEVGDYHTYDKTKAASVTLHDSDSTASIYYTTDGTTPTVSSKKYTSGFSVTKETEIKAIAVAPGLPASDVFYATVKPVDCSFELTGIKEEIENKSGFDIKITKCPEILDYSDISFSAYNSKLNLDFSDINQGIVHVNAVSIGDSGISVNFTPCTYSVNIEFLDIKILPGKMNVDFYDYDGNLIEHQIVEEGTAATEPNVQVPTGYRFVGWNKTFDNILDHTDIYAKKYELIKYDISYCNIPAGLSYTPVATKYDIETGISLSPAPDMDEEHPFIEWNTKPDGSGVEMNQIEIGTYGDISLYAQYGYTGGLKISAIPEQEYIGTAIKPEADIVVTYDATVLKSGVDYQLSYKNNVKAGTATVTVTGKGNYTGKDTAEFTINPINLSDASHQVVTYSISDYYKEGKTPKITPEILCDGKKLKQNTDFTIDGVEEITGPGSYTITINGCGNYSSYVEIQYNALSAEGLSFSKAKVGKIPSIVFDEEKLADEGGLVPDWDLVSVKYGKDPLTYGEDYTVKAYFNNTKIGTATAILSGLGDYTGEKRVTYSIVGNNIGKAKVVLSNPVYDGTLQSGNENVELIAKISGVDTTLTKGTDYIITGTGHTGNLNAGKATIIFIGINSYTGQLKKTYKVLPYDILADTDNRITINTIADQTYTKGSVNPDVEINFEAADGSIIRLVNGKDYTLSYANNKKCGQTASVTITGKGNFKGKIKDAVTYNIVKKDIGDIPVSNMSALDIEESAKAGKYTTKVEIYDTNGKKLAAKTDYLANLKYYDSDNHLLNAQCRALAGETLYVEIEGTGQYTGTVRIPYKVISPGKNLMKAKASVNKGVYKEFTGNKVKLLSSEYSVVLGGVTLREGIDYTITFQNNIKKGKATAIIQGIGEYGGVKKMNYTIGSMKMKWF